jgi:phosphopantothenoylcysteine decarboxylase/phosphopantothenate--cysteine ligase
MKRPLSALRVLLTAGPTREPLDPVRYLSNHSSGEMGLTLAARLAALGARVTVVLGPVSRARPRGVEVVDVETAREMNAAVTKRLPRADVFIATAAVCDWRFEKTHSSKMKKGRAVAMTVRLVKNPDILGEAGARKRRTGRGPLLVGFALETNALEAYARKKLVEKNLDLVIGNTPRSFGSRRITPLWIERNGPARRLPSMTKNALSSEIGRWLAGRPRP